MDHGFFLTGPELLRRGSGICDGGIGVVDLRKDQTHTTGDGKQNAKGNACGKGTLPAHLFALAFFVVSAAAAPLALPDMIGIVGHKAPPCVLFILHDSLPFHKS
jgi:hypothetical protein